MSTFIGQLVGFAVIVWIIGRYVVPPIRRLMASQKDAVRQQLEDSAAASERLASASQFHAKRIEEARAEARHIAEEARADSVRIGEQLRAQADVEVERIKVQGQQQLALLRSQLVRQLRADLGSESVRRAADLVRSHVADPQARAATVDRFLDQLEAMAPAASAPEIASSTMRSASREAQAALVERFNAVAVSLNADALSTLSEDLSAVVKLLLREPILARHLAEATGAADAKKQLLQRLLGERISGPAREVLDTAVSVRWSKTGDFVSAVEHVARLALLVRAEREQQADEVAEQLFRFSRLLDTQPRLVTLLSDPSRPAGGRTALLGSVLESSGVNPIARTLLTQTVEQLDGERADDAVQELAQLAVAHRGEIVAQVSAAADLTDTQRSRLTQVLNRIYHVPVSVQLTIDPELLGGLSVAVGDEVIDGTLATRLAAAETKLPD